MHPYISGCMQCNTCRNGGCINVRWLKILCSATWLNTGSSVNVHLYSHHFGMYCTACSHWCRDAWSITYSNHVIILCYPCLCTLMASSRFGTSLHHLDFVRNLFTGLFVSFFLIIFLLYWCRNAFDVAVVASCWTVDTLLQSTQHFTRAPPAFTKNQCNSNFACMQLASTIIHKLQQLRQGCWTSSRVPSCRFNTNRARWHCGVTCTLLRNNKMASNR